MVDGHWKRLATSSALLAVVVLVAGGLLALIGSTVFPQAGMFVWAAVVLLVFVLFQLAMFRVLGLRSHADELPADTRPAPRQAASVAQTDEHAHEHVPPGAADAEDADDAEAAEGAEGADARDWRAWRG